MCVRRETIGPKKHTGLGVTLSSLVSRQRMLKINLLMARCKPHNAQTGPKMTVSSFIALGTASLTPTPQPGHPMPFRLLTASSKIFWQPLHAFCHRTAKDGPQRAGTGNLKPAHHMNSSNLPNLSLCFLLSSRQTGEPQAHWLDSAPTPCTP